jgi:hypothetical protein
LKQLLGGKRGYVKKEVSAAKEIYRRNFFAEN